MLIHSSSSSVNPEQWGQILKQVVDSQVTRHHLYIVTDSKGYKVTESPAEGQQKLTILQIVDISKGVLSQEELNDEVKVLTNKLIDARKEKREHNFLLNTARIFSFIGSFIGLPFYRTIKHEDEEFEREIRGLRETLAANAEEELTLIPVRVSEQEAVKEASSQAPSLEEQTSALLADIDAKKRQIRQQEQRLNFVSINAKPEERDSFVESSQKVLNMLNNELIGLERRLEELNENKG